VHSTDREPNKREPNKQGEQPKDLREANENVRKSQGDDATGPVDNKVDNKRTGNKPAFDRDR
jgi:hypothetical protein